MQHRLHHQLRAFQEIRFVCQHGFVALLLHGRERPPERLPSEFPHKLLPTFRRWLTGKQPMRIATAKGRSRQLLRGVAISLLEQRRKALPAGLVQESVDEVLRRKLHRRCCLVAQQIAHRVVVLAVC